MSRLFTPVLALASLLAVGQSALAGETSSMATGRQVTVSYADLNLRGQAGAQALMGRLRVAARDACGMAPAFDAMRETQVYDACIRTALDNAVTNVGSPELAAIYEGRAAPDRVARQ